MSYSDDRFDVTIAPPAAGPAPMPPSELREVFATLQAIQAGPRAVQDRLRPALRVALRIAVAVVPGAVAVVPFGRYAPRAHGLSARETARWAQQVRETLSGPQRALLLEYVHTCRDWEGALRAAIERSESDWELVIARYGKPSADEDALADSLKAFGIPVHVHAYVAEYGAINPRWAHRDIAYLLRIAIELDGQYLHLHLRDEGQEHDQQRDRILADHGWYVAQLSGSIMRPGIHGLAGERLAALVEQHRRAIMLARSDLPALKRNLV